MNKKKILKLIGTILVIVSLGFIGRNIWSSKDQLIEAITPQSLLLSLLLSVLVAVSLLLFAMCYKMLLNAMTGTKVSSECIPQYVKSTLYKYLPGNIMHFVGRNALVEKGSVTFAQVNGATILEILVTLAASFTVAMAFSGRYIWEFLVQYLDFKYVLLIALAGVIALIAGLTVFRKKIEPIWKQVINKKVLKVLLIMFIINSLWNIIGNSFFCLIVRTLGCEMSFRDYRISIGAGTGAWFVGFIVPGAPGGLGIREAMMNFLLAGIAPDWAISTVSVFTRIAQIIGEILANIVILVYVKAGREQTNKGKRG